MTATVVKVMEFGAFVNFFGAQGRPGSHQPALRQPRAEDLRRGQGRRQGQGQACSVSTTAARPGLSMKAVDQTTGEDLEAKAKTRKPRRAEAAAAR